MRALAAGALALAMLGAAPSRADVRIPVATDALIPVENFVRRAELENVTISPGGQYVAAIVPLEDGSTILYVMERATMKRSAAIKGVTGNVVDRYWWVNGTRLVASIAEKLGGVDRPQPTGELFAVNADGSGATQLFGYRGAGETGSRIKRGGEKRLASATVIDLVPGDDRHVLIETIDWAIVGGAARAPTTPPNVELLDVYNGTTHQISAGPKPQSSFVADHHGRIRVATAPGEDLDDVMYVRAANGEPWRVYNDPKTSRVHVEPLMFARDDRRLYARVSQPHAPDALVRIDLDGGAREVLYSGGADPGPLLPTPDGLDAYCVVTRDGRTAIHVFDPQSADGRRALALQNAFPGQVALLTSFAEDGRHGLLHVFSDRNPGDFYLFDTEKKNASYIGSARKWIDPERMAAMQPVAFKASDGLELHGYLTLPPGAGRDLPLVVNPHGGPYGIRDEWAFDPEVQLLASRGYAVLQVDYRGSGGYGADFLHAGFRQWGLRMQDDLADATRWAVAQGYADPKRLCIYGASYGGYAALEGVVRDPDLYRCAIGYVGVYDLAMMYRDGDIPRSLFGKRYLELVIGSDPDDLRRRSPVAGVDRIEAALMLVAGGRDLRVPIAHADALRSALDRVGHPYEWLVKDAEGHGFYRTDDQIELYTKMLDFLGRSLRTTATP